MSVITNKAMVQAQRFKNDVEWGDSSLSERIKTITIECAKLGISLKETSVVTKYALGL